MSNSQSPQREGCRRFGADNRPLVVLSTHLVSYPNRSIPAFRLEDSAQSARPRLAPNAAAGYPEPTASIGGRHVARTPMPNGRHFRSASACASRAEPRRLFRGPLSFSSDGDLGIHHSPGLMLWEGRVIALCAPAPSETLSRGKCLGPFPLAALPVSLALRKSLREGPRDT